MIGNSLLTQVIVAAIAIGIIITYIQPKFGEIKTRQDEITQTQAELQQVTEVNDRLATLYRQLNAIPQQDKSALFIYLPDRIDEVQILKDLSRMVEDVKVELKSIRYDGTTTRSAGGPTEGGPYPHLFTLSFEASYEAMKNLLSYLERHNYPLVIDRMSVKPTEGGFLNVDMSLITYSFSEVENN